jgi:molybdopterin synthase catalytic subunit
MQKDWIELIDQPLDAARVVAFVTDPNAGGITIFLGATRAETNPSGQPLLALDYDAYREMAIKQMSELAARAKEKWPVERLAILHRTGRVNVGDPSVIIGVSTPHRAQAFEACRWLIDTLKADVAIWKKEVWEDGSATWVHPLSPSASEGELG